jgi:Na+-driven multidrug efflux pump
VVDALFLGHFAGPQALAAVTLMFPLYMLIVALATLVSSGMSSILARHLGAGRVREARATTPARMVWPRLHGAVLIALFLGLRKPVALLAAGGSEDLAGMGLTYLRIMVFAAPLIFVLSVNSDALRNEGLVMLMAAMSLLVSLSQHGLQLRPDRGARHGRGGVGLRHGVGAGAGARHHPRLPLLRRHGAAPLGALAHSPVSGWGRILALGAPQSLNFIGLALGSGAIIAALQWVEAPDYDATVSAYGIVTRLITFAFLPLLGLAHAMQTITGNNFRRRGLPAQRREPADGGPRGLRLLPACRPA